MPLSASRWMLVTICGLFIFQNAHAGICSWLLSRFARTIRTSEIHAKTNPDINEVVAMNTGLLTVNTANGPKILQVIFTKDSDSFGDSTYRLRFPANSKAEGFEIFQQITIKFNETFGDDLVAEESPINEDDFQTGYLEARRLETQYHGYQGYEVYFHRGRGETAYAARLLQVLKKDFSMRPEL